MLVLEIALGIILASILPTLAYCLLCIVLSPFMALRDALVQTAHKMPCKKMATPVNLHAAENAESIVPRVMCRESRFISLAARKGEVINRIRAENAAIVARLNGQD
jgi:hypothetical protein